MSCHAVRCLPAAARERAQDGQTAEYRPLPDVTGDCETCGEWGHLEQGMCPWCRARYLREA